MTGKLMVIKKNVATGKKEWIYTIYDSIFDVIRDNNNEYILKKLNEIETYFKGNDSQYELKVISDAEYETMLFNNRLNNIKSPNVGNFFCFLIEYARYLDKLYTGHESNLYTYNNSYSTLKSWTLQTLLDLKREQASPGKPKR